MAAGKPYPLVSIVIPTYNSIRYLPQTINSAFAQTYPNTEIIVVDDESTDGTGDTLHAQYGNAIRYFYKTNEGPGIARNHGIEAAQGDYIKFLDADDQLHPEYLTRVMDEFATHDEQVVLVHTNHRVFGAVNKANVTPLLSGDIFCELLLSNGAGILTSTTTVRKSALQAVGLFPPMYLAEDWDLFLRLAAHYQVAAIDNILVDYRVHEHNLTGSTIESARGRLQVLEQARGYRDGCLSDNEYDALLASRHHVLAMFEWEAGNRDIAQQHLQQAIQYTPQSRRIRQVYHALSRFAPYQAATLLDGLLQLIR